MSTCYDCREDDCGCKPVRKVRGFCPMEGGETLVLNDEDFIICSAPGCPRPDAASLILADTVTEHVVDIGANDFVVKHPLCERLDMELNLCGVHEWLANMVDAPQPLGRYMLQWEAGKEPVWLRVEGVAAE